MRRTFCVLACHAVTPPASRTSLRIYTPANRCRAIHAQTLRQEPRLLPVLGTTLSAAWRIAWATSASMMSPKSLPHCWQRPKNTRTALVRSSRVGTAEYLCQRPSFPGRKTTMASNALDCYHAPSPSPARSPIAHTKVPTAYGCVSVLTNIVMC